MEAKVKEMEETLRFNQQTMDEIKQVLRYLADNKEHADWKRLYRLIGSAEQLTYTQLTDFVRSVVNRSSDLNKTVSVQSELCRFSELTPSTTDIQVFSCSR